LALDNISLVEDARAKWLREAVGMSNRKGESDNGPIRVDIEQSHRISELTIAHYDRLAEAYWDGTREHDVSQNYAALLDAIEGNPPYSILYLGCGPSRDLHHFRSLGHNAVGLDGSKEFVAMARSYSGCEVRWKTRSVPRRLAALVARQRAVAAMVITSTSPIFSTEGHHLDVSFGWGYAIVSLSTEKIKGLHENDFIIASKIDRVLDRSVPRPLVVIRQILCQSSEAVYATHPNR
jgi:pterin-4a-carbinolamine dehydratase